MDTPPSPEIRVASAELEKKISKTQKPSSSSFETTKYFSASASSSVKGMKHAK